MENRVDVQEVWRIGYKKIGCPKQLSLSLWRYTKVQDGLLRKIIQGEFGEVEGG